jgi:hypothetical protein
MSGMSLNSCQAWVLAQHAPYTTHNKGLTRTQSANKLPPKEPLDFANFRGPTHITIFRPTCKPVQTKTVKPESREWRSRQSCEY